MAVTKTPIATDSAKELRNVIGDDASATFESDPKFIDSNPTEGASSDHLELRDTDDTEDSEEEEEEADEEEEEEEADEDFDDDEEDVDEDDDEESDDDDDDEEEEDEDFDDEGEDNADEVLKAAEDVDVPLPGKRSRADIEAELEESGGEFREVAGDNEEGLHVDLAINEALRMSALSIAEQGAAQGY